MEDTAQASYTAPRNFEFTGNGWEYFRIWIVNIALTVLTLGIFSAWAKVRRLRYFYGHTWLDGHNFAYLANPVKILKGRVLAVALLIIYSAATSLLPGLALYILTGALLLVPLVIVTSSAFQLRNSAYRNVRFGFGGAVRAAYAALLPPLGVLLLIVAAIWFSVDAEGVYDETTGEMQSRADLLSSFISLALLPVLPWLDHVRMRFVIANSRFGNLKAGFEATLWDFYKLYLGLFAMFFCIVMLTGFVGAVGVGLARTGNPEDEGAVVTTILLLLPLVYAAIFMIGAWFMARRGNLLRNSTHFGGQRLEGRLQTGALIRLYLGNLFMIIITLGLFIPFAAIRLHRYNAAHTAAQTQGLDQVVTVAEQERSAIGEEIGEVFDVDIGL